MNIILKKILFSALTFSVAFNCSFAANEKELPTNFVETVFQKENEFNWGYESKIYRSEYYYPQYILKVYSNHALAHLNAGMEKYCDNGKFKKIDRADLKKLSKEKTLGDNLMKVISVLDDRSMVVLEYIEGETFKNSDFEGIKLTLDFFIDKWCIGLIKGIKKLHDVTGHYLDDINDENIIIKKLPEGEAIPIIIDYSFKTNPTEFEQLGEILLEAMDCVIGDDIRNNDKRYEVLCQYITKKNKSHFTLKETKNNDTIAKVINDLQKIKEGTYVSP